MATTKKPRLTIEQAGEYSPAVLSNMDLSEIRRVADVTFQTANKRVKSLTKAGLAAESPAVADLGRHRKFSTKFLDAESMVIEIERARQFLSNPTSTVRGTRTFVNDMEIGFRQDKKRELTSKDWDNIHAVTDHILMLQGGYTYDPSDIIKIAQNILTGRKRTLKYEDLRASVKQRIWYLAAINRPLKTIHPVLVEEAF